MPPFQLVYIIRMALSPPSNHRVWNPSLPKENTHMLCQGWVYDPNHVMVSELSPSIFCWSFGKRFFVFVRVAKLGEFKWGVSVAHICHTRDRAIPMITVVAEPYNGKMLCPDNLAGALDVSVAITRHTQGCSSYLLILLTLVWIVMISFAKKVGRFRLNFR